jgi:hypothetical protein
VWAHGYLVAYDLGFFGFFIGAHVHVVMVVFVAMQVHGDVHVWIIWSFRKWSHSTWHEANRKSSKNIPVNGPSESTRGLV